MEKSSLRLPAIYNYFIDNIGAFSKYIGNDKYVNEFFDNLMTVLSLHSVNPELTFGQALVKAGIIPSDFNPSVVNRDEIRWFLDHALVEPEYLYVWRSYGPDSEQKFKEWNAKKPKLNARLTTAEIKLGYASLKNYEVYARRYEIWSKQSPKQSETILVDLSTDEIKNILLTETDISEEYRSVFEKILEDRGENKEESVKLKDVEIEC